ncbi:hypothetical protein mRhiFer1_009972 [Rhinolophus ferrumequinum]|uniref:Uncharacterized protein n=1 Tax=Rhinolophus ferrumequinum TaxID=59479 RepID=A0A7J7YJB2_RHIFE|nr:hypothetical protein mRhiFer1_009972 [Rhinolophus ferrumequinum]
MLPGVSNLGELSPRLEMVIVAPQERWNENPNHCTDLRKSTALQVLMHLSAFNFTEPLPQESFGQEPVVSGFGLLVFDEVTLLEVTEGTAAGESVFMTVKGDDSLLLCPVREGTFVEESLREDEIVVTAIDVFVIVVDSCFVDVTLEFVTGCDVIIEVPVADAGAGIGRAVTVVVFAVPVREVGISCSSCS